VQSEVRRQKAEIRRRGQKAEITRQRSEIRSLAVQRHGVCHGLFEKSAEDREPAIVSSAAVRIAS